MGRWVSGCSLLFIHSSSFSLCVRFARVLFPAGRTPLHYAAANGRYQCTVTLVNAGAEVNEPDQTGCTPLHYCAASQAFSRFGKCLPSNHLWYREYLSKAFWFIICLILCSIWLASNHFCTSFSRVDRHFSGNHQNNEDEAKESYLWVSALRTWLWYEADFRWKTCWEKPLCARLPLYIFLSSFAASCLEHLLDNGADPSMVNSKGYSAVHYAAYHGNKQNLELVGLDSH